MQICKTLLINLLMKCSDMEFEKAAEVRDKIKELENLS